MYTAFYGLREKPFALVPDPRYLFLAESHREALAHLLYGIDQSEGFIAVTGEVGTGKTTICRTLLGRLGPDTEFAFLFNPSPSGVELLQDICSEFGIESEGLSRSDLSAELNRFLVKKKQENRRVLLIVDEAQNLSKSTLEQIRLLSNLETSSQKLIQILLLGQPELDRKLDSPDLRQLRQRISVRWGLHALTAKETRTYVKHRLHVAAGAERDIFTNAALREIHWRSGGVPRLINVLCDRVLLAGYVARASRIGGSIVRQASREIPDTRRRRRFSLPAASVEKFKEATGLAARRLGAGAVFGAGLALGLAIAGGLLVGSIDSVREQMQPYLPSFMAEPEDVDVAAQAQPAVSSGPPQTTTASLIAPGSPLLRDLFEEEVQDTGEPEGQPGQAGVSTVHEAKIEEMSNAVARELAAGEFLGAVLGEERPDTMRRGALNGILEAFGEDPFETAPASDEMALSWLEERGLTTMSLRSSTLQSLLKLNHPLLLRVRASELGEQRLVGVLRIDGDLASLYGVAAAGPLWVPVDELLQQWDGEGWAVWHDFEATRPILAYGEEGQSVSWLQKALSELGYFEGDVSGFFDTRTVESLQEFQRRRKLQADGMAGPRTRMVLYQLLDRYKVPRLESAERGAAG